MKKTIITLLAGAALLASCSQDKEYVIYGTVSNPDLEGAQVFLVPLENATKETIDSVCIHNQMFEFRGTEEKMAYIRIERFKRMGNENLLVVTEPGETFVTIGEVSSLRAQGKKDEAAALREKHIARTRQMAKNVGNKTD